MRISITHNPIPLLLLLLLLLPLFPLLIFPLPLPLPLPSPPHPSSKVPTRGWLTQVQAATCGRYRGVEEDEDGDGDGNRDEMAGQWMSEAAWDLHGVGVLMHLACFSMFSPCCSLVARTLLPHPTSAPVYQVSHLCRTPTSSGMMRSSLHDKVNRGQGERLHNCMMPKGSERTKECD